MNRGDVNLLDIHGMRRVEHNPPHFKSIVLEKKIPPKVLIDWIYLNLSGRFHISDYFSLTEINERANSAINQSCQSILVSFEDGSELTFLCLSLDNIIENFSTLNY